ncbi:MAG: hypothetical protein Q9209_003135 [Squamulea sp. 1 TL-2023]
MPAISPKPTALLSASQQTDVSNPSPTIGRTGESPALSQRRTSDANIPPIRQATGAPVPGQTDFEVNKPGKLSPDEVRFVIDALQQHSLANLPLALHPYYNWAPVKLTWPCKLDQQQTLQVRWYQSTKLSFKPSSPEKRSRDTTRDYRPEVFYRRT